MKPHGVQLSRRKGWRMPPNTVSVARPSRWGNPYSIWRDGCRWAWGWHLRQDSTFSTKEKAAAESVRAYRRYRRAFIKLSAIRRDLRGKNLACWCPIGTACHRDVLLQLANSRAEARDWRRKVPDKERRDYRIVRYLRGE